MSLVSKIAKNISRTQVTAVFAVALIAAASISLPIAAASQHYSWGMANFTPDETESGVGISLSSDGKNIAYATNSAAIHTSTNGGQSWTRHGDIGLGWYGIDSSANGQVIAAVGPSGHKVVVSTNGGATWTHTASIPSGYLTDISVSKDGTKIVGVGQDHAASEALMYISSDSGATWTVASNLLPNSVAAQSAAVSGDGNTVLVVAQHDGDTAFQRNLYVSNDGGATFTHDPAGLVDQYFLDTVIASDDGAMFALGGAQWLYRSDDNGATWTGVPGVGNIFGLRIDASANGDVISIAHAGGVRLSTDGGLSWLDENTGAQGDYFYTTSVSGDGLTVAATNVDFGDVDLAGQVYIGTAPGTPPGPGQGDGDDSGSGSGAGTGTGSGSDDSAPGVPNTGVLQLALTNPIAPLALGAVAIATLFVALKRRESTK